MGNNNRNHYRHGSRNRKRYHVRDYSNDRSVKRRRRNDDRHYEPRYDQYSRFNSTRYDHKESYGRRRSSSRRRSRSFHRSNRRVSVKRKRTRSRHREKRKSREKSPKKRSKMIKKEAEEQCLQVPPESIPLPPDEPPPNPQEKKQSINKVATNFMRHLESTLQIMKTALDKTVQQETKPKPLLAEQAPTCRSKRTRSKTLESCGNSCESFVGSISDMGPLSNQNLPFYNERLSCPGKIDWDMFKPESRAPTTRHWVENIQCTCPLALPPLITHDNHDEQLKTANFIGCDRSNCALARLRVFCDTNDCDNRFICSNIRKNINCDLSRCFELFSDTRKTDGWKLRSKLKFHRWSLLFPVYFPTNKIDPVPNNCHNQSSSTLTLQLQPHLSFNIHSHPTHPINFITYLNHDMIGQSNCVIEKWLDKGRTIYSVFATKSINKGDLLILNVPKNGSCIQLHYTKPTEKSQHDSVLLFQRYLIHEQYNVSEITMETNTLNKSISRNSSLSSSIFQQGMHIQLMFAVHELIERKLVISRDLARAVVQLLEKIVAAGAVPMPSVKLTLKNHTSSLTALQKCLEKVGASRTLSEQLLGTISSPSNEPIPSPSLQMMLCCRLPPFWVSRLVRLSDPHDTQPPELDLHDDTNILVSQGVDNVPPILERDDDNTHNLEKNQCHFSNVQENGCGGSYSDNNNNGDVDGDADGCDINMRVLFCHTLTHHTQWEMPVYPWETTSESCDLASDQAYNYNEASNFPILHNEIQNMYVSLNKQYEMKQKKLQINDHSKLQKKMQLKKLAFKSKISAVVCEVLRPHKNPSCSHGRIQNEEDYKYLVNKLSETILQKELKTLGERADWLRVNESVEAKARTYVRVYMEGRGALYVRHAIKQEEV